MNSTTSLRPSARNALLTAIVSLAILASQSSAFADYITPATSSVPQDRIYADWARTHSGNNQHEVNNFGNARKINCDVSHNLTTNVNTVSGCRFVPR
jgi:hypothetical protein